MKIKLNKKKNYCLILVIASLIFNIAFAQNQKSVESKEIRDALMLARGLERAGKIERAIQVYEQLISRKPNNPGILNNYISLLEEEKQYKKIEKVLQKYISNNPDPISAQIKLGKLYYQRGEKEKALQKWKKLYKKNIRNTNMHKKMVEQYLELNEYESCIGMIKYLREKRQDQYYLNYELGDVYQRKSNYKAAVREYLAPALKNDKMDQAEQKILSLPDSLYVFNEIQNYLKKKLNQKSSTKKLQLYKKILFKYGNYNQAQKVVFQIEKNAKYPGTIVLDFAKNLRKEAQDSLAREVYYKVMKEEKLKNIHRRSLLGLANLYEEKFNSQRTITPLQFYRPDNYFFNSGFYHLKSKNTKYLNQAFSIYDTLLNKKRLGFSARINYKLGKLSLYATKDFEKSLQFNKIALKQTNDYNLKVNCMRNIIHTLLAQGKIEQAQDQLKDYFQKLSKQDREKLAPTGLLLQFYRDTAQIDSLAQNLLDKIDFSGKYYNDILELLNFVRNTKNNEGYSNFLKGERFLRQNDLAQALNQYNYIVDNFADSKLFDEACFRTAQLNLFFENYNQAQKNISDIDSTSELKKEALFMYALIMDKKVKNYQAAQNWYKKLLANYPGYMKIGLVRERLREIRKRQAG